ncbi:MAG: right-handed parallel beta-helix repeat-containing protein [Candidatus Hodarchaeota archaeon]
MRTWVIIFCVILSLVLGLSSHIPKAQSFPSAQPKDLFELTPRITLGQLEATESLQEWNVTSSETRTGEIIVLDDLIVQENVTLTLMNCTIQINSTESNMGRIEINGMLVIRNYTTIRAVNASFGYHFFLNPTSSFEAVNSTIRDVGRNSAVSSDRGIYSTGKQVILQSTTITRCVDGLIVATNNSVRVQDCRIVNNTLTGVRIEGQGGNVIVEGSVIEGSSYGVQIYQSLGNNTIRDCNITTNIDGVGIVGYSAAPLGNNRISENQIISQGRGAVVEQSRNNTILGNWISSQSTGIALQSSNENLILGNQIVSEFTGIILRFSVDNRIETNEIEVNNTGSGILLEAAASRNLLQENFIHRTEIGIGMRSTSLNRLIGNRIRDTQQAAILIELSPAGTYLSSNEVIVSSGVALRISQSSSITVENNSITVSSNITDPAIYLDETGNCSFIANQISVEGAAFYLDHSSNIILSENVIISTFGVFLLADDFSRNTTLTIWNNVNTTALYPRATLILIPPTVLESEIASMTLYYVNRGGKILPLSNATAPNLELVLNALTLGGGNFTIMVSIAFLNGTEANWSFSLFIYGEPTHVITKTITYATTSNTNWVMITPLLLGTFSLAGWIRKGRSKGKEFRTQNKFL